MSENRVEDREFDVVVFGVTGFAGRLVAAYLAERHADTDLRWAMAGRNLDKLKAVDAELGTGVPLIVADSSDPASLERMAARTKVVCTTVGPYSLYGAPLVAACIATQTHCCDLTGETTFIREMVDSHHEQAVAAGVRIVHCCGFDSIPSDLGTWLLQEKLLQRDGQPAEEGRLFVKAMRGGVSGGTVASMLHMLEAARDPKQRKVLLHPYSLNPPEHRKGPARRSPIRATPDPVTGWWGGPFVMAAINERVVRRSNAMLGNRYGAEFLYTEVSRTGTGFLGWLRAQQMSMLFGAFFGAIAFGPTRWMLKRFVLPNPGQGPSEKTIENGYFVIVVSGRRGGQEVGRVIVNGKRDPGYGATACMLAESAICLAKDTLASSGGIHTPASAMGETLLERLNRQDVTFEWQPLSPS